MLLESCVVDIFKAQWSLICKLELTVNVCCEADCPSPLSFCCDPLVWVASNSGGLPPCCRSRTSAEELSDGVCVLALTWQQQLAQNQNKPPARKSLCRPCSVPCSWWGFILCTCQVSEVWVCLGHLQEGGGDMPRGASGAGGREATLSSCPRGIVQRCQGEVLAGEPVMHKNDFLKRFLLFWLVVWELWSEVVPFVEQLKFDALFLLFCTVRVAVSIFLCHLASFPFCWKKLQEPYICFKTKQWMWLRFTAPECCCPVGN